MTAVFNVMSIYLVELAPSSWFITHHIRLRGIWCRDVVQLDYLAPDSLTTNVQRCEAFFCLTYPFECWFFLYGWGIIAIPPVVWAINHVNTLLNVACLLFGVSFLIFYVALNSGDQLWRWQHWFLGEGLVEVSHFKSILEHPHNFFWFGVTILWRSRWSGRDNSSSTPNDPSVCWTGW